MPSLDWNTTQWGRQYEWPQGGDEWSEPWGNATAQWFGSLFPRVHRFMPAPRILEIAPGHGRWTQFLVPASSQYIGVDLNESCTEVCKARFASADNATFVTNDGVSLAAAEDGSIDFLFSFDSLVHAEFEVFEGYIPEILRVLAPGGVAFIHHSNLAQGTMGPGQHDHSRAKTVSGERLSGFIEQSGGKVLVRETISWIDADLIDCLTTFARQDGDWADQPTQVLENPQFIEEMNAIRLFQAAYSRLGEK